MAQILGGVLASGCPYCGSPLTSQARQAMQCASCGAALQIPASKAGWTQVPSLQDMAELDFEHGSCQICGAYVPVADVKLSGSGAVYFTHHVLLWKDPQIEIHAMSLKQGWKRLFAGLPLVMTRATGSGHIAFSHDAPGQLIALLLEPGQVLDVREHLFLLASQSVAYDWISSNVWFRTRDGDDSELVYPIGPFMDRFAASQSGGLLLLQAPGNVLTRELADGEVMLIKPASLLLKEPTVNMNLHVEAPRQASGLLSVRHRTFWLRLIGPGRVVIHSAYEHLEDDGQPLQASSPRTYHDW